MKGFFCLVLILVLSSVSATAATGQDQQPDSQADMVVEGSVGTAFTYQGRLTEGGSPATGVYDLQFKLYAVPNGGSSLGEVKVDDVAVVEGLFTVLLNFGSGAFVGEARYLEIGVQPGSGGGGYTILTPRQALTPTPYAIYASSAGAAPWDGLSGVPAGLGDGDDDSLGELSCAGSQVAKWNGSAWVCAADDDDDTLGGLSCDAGQVAKWDGRAWVCAADDGGGGDRFWSLGGNAGTTPGSHFLGTTDNKALEVRVNGARALRLEPNSASPNLVGGHMGNAVNAGVAGGTIGGGGSSAWPHKVTDNGGTIGGGVYNQAGDGDGNLTDATYASVAGGFHNVASGASAAIGGGYENEASGGYAAVCGGLGNDATAYAATVGGGQGNAASAPYSTVGGGGRSDPSKPETANHATDRWTTVGGGARNLAGNGNGDTTDAEYATVGGGYRNTANGRQATVAGGADNMATYRATIAGGLTNRALGSYSAIPGGYLNTTLGSYAFAAGKQAKANHAGAFVWADSTSADFASQKADEFAVRASGGVRFQTNGGFAVENSSGKDIFAVDSSGKMTAGDVTNQQLSLTITLYHEVQDGEGENKGNLPGQHNFCTVVNFYSFALGTLDEDIGLIECRTWPVASGGGEWTGPGTWEYLVHTDEYLFCTFACF